MAPQNAQQFTTAWAIRQERAFGRETKTVTNGQKKLQMGVSAKKDLRIWEGGVACSGRVRVVGATRRDDLAEARSGLSAHRVCRINNAPGGSVQRLCCASVTLFGNSIALWGGRSAWRCWAQGLFSGYCVIVTLLADFIALSLHFVGGCLGKGGFWRKKGCGGVGGVRGRVRGVSIPEALAWKGLRGFPRAACQGCAEGAHVGRPPACGAAGRVARGGRGGRVKGTRTWTRTS